ncbi:MAG: acyl-CoA thioesterase [Bdellovibrionales bacterium]|nr:acyl-CoA thioesterase [Bdellovibrionales bacterium]
MFSYERRVAFSDTDAMGVTHHANYVRYFEEARVAWMRSKDLSRIHYPKADHVLAVLRFQVWHMKPCTFDDLLVVQLQVRREGAKIHFQYAVLKNGERIAEAETLHIPVNSALRPMKPAPELSAQLEKEAWIETWLSNS